MKNLKKWAAMMISVTALGLMLTGCGGNDAGKRIALQASPLRLL